MERKDVVVHKASLYENEPYSVECMAVDDVQGILAVARRADYGEERKRESLLEFWNIIKKPVFHMKTRRSGSGGVQALLWIKSYLLSNHLDGSILIHQLHRPDNIRIQVCPSPLWSLTALNNNRFCAGSDSGGVFFLILNNDKAVVEKTVNIGFGLRVLSLAANEKVVAAGSIDQISIVDADKTKILHTLQLPRTEKRKPTIVWCLGFVGDVLVSGDSRGCVSFWNVKNGTLFQTIASHQADVLSLCVSDCSVYAAGVDPTVVRMSYNQSRTTFRINHAWRMHNNDVRALVVSGGRLFSGGAQHQFYISTYTECEAAVKTPIAFYLHKKNFVLYQYAKYLIIWLLGKAEGSANKNGDFLLSKVPVKLAKIPAPNNEYIISSSMNEDGSFLALSTHRSLSLYHTSFALLDHETISKHSISIRKVSELGSCASCMAFADNWLYYTTESLRLCRIDYGQPEFATTIAIRENSGEAVRISLSSTANSHRIALLTTKNEVLYKPANSDMLYALDLKGLQSPIMDVQFKTADSLSILCASTERTLFECFPETENGQIKGKSIFIQQVAPGSSSNEVFMLHKNDHIQSMHAAPWGICLVSTYGAIRLLVSVDGKRAVLYTDVSCKSRVGHDKPCSIQWVEERSVLLSLLAASCGTSQEGFRLKRFRQN